MKKLAFLAISMLLLSTLVFAHGNLAHVIGTVVEVTDHSISVKIADGSVKVVAFDGETHFLKGTVPATIKDIVVGSRVVIRAHQNGDKFHAAEVKIGINTAAANSKPVPAEAK
jgi:hypothetical protein